MPAAPRLLSYQIIVNYKALIYYQECLPESLLETLCGVRLLLLLPLLGRYQLIQHVLLLLFSILGQGTSQEGKIDIQILVLGLLVCLSNVLILLRGLLQRGRIQSAKLHTFSSGLSIVKTFSRTFSLILAPAFATYDYKRGAIVVLALRSWDMKDLRNTGGKHVGNGR